ncbi:cysteine hydrolase family protein [Sulfurospirillum multivorans]|uniref:Isochorismatase family protein n=2 Tax=Sulfurospirillum multivorans TaxID=66821 RepID=A0AA86AKP6_SULMK|nr:cysteine hydrolase family protein [Sulfurospirillum multivorans]AHJ11347.1 isochorismatase family protein [Sulfurospirillum multivorans DSM 12446]QEH04851.1 isochorismatase family protein [Sulfurospirillum multivorans]
MKRALIVVDVQNEYFEGGALPISYPSNSFERIKTAIAEAQKAGILIVFMQHTSLKENAGAFVRGSHLWEFHDEIKAIKPDLYIEKNHASSFVGTDLNYRLRALGIDTVSIIGYMTQNCCDATARDASQLGYNVEFLSDANGTLDFENTAGSVSAEALHRAFLVAQAFGFSRVLTLNEWIPLLKKD